MDRIINLGETNRGNFAFTIGEEHPGNREEYSTGQCNRLNNSLLKNKTIYWLGSSITYGFGSMGESMADFIAERNGCHCYKSAISGTTLADIVYDAEDANNPWKALGRDEDSLEETASQPYVKRLFEFPKEVKPDIFVIQVSTNDSQFPEIYQGRITEGFSREGFDVHTTFGAAEFILSYIKEIWNCPVMFYTSPLLDSDNYLAMVENTKEMCKKWKAHLLDMNGDKEFNNKGKSNYDLYMVDPVHPTRAGYQLWWTPVFEEQFTELLRLGYQKPLLTP